jgi:leader peptidase (prepilin peptidase)/N-methyltransferase
VKLSYISWLVLLLAVSYQDYRRKEISVRLLLIMGIVGTLIQIFEKSVTLGSWIGGILLGMLLLFLGFVTEEQIGYGDGWLVLVMGMSLGFGISILSLLLALGLSALAGGILLILKRVNRNDRIPFAPFLLAGCLICFGTWG